MDTRDVAALVQRYREKSGMTQVAIAEALSADLGRRINQSQVSEHLRGLRWKDLDLAGAYVRVLGIPPDEMAAAMGYPIPGRAARAVTLADVIKADKSLSPAAKKHLLNQYGLLQLATKQERSGNPVLQEPQTSRKSGRSATG